MNLFDRFILTLYSFALTVLSVVVIAASLRLIPYSMVEWYVQGMYSSNQIRYTYLIAALIFFLISLKFLLQGFKRDRNRGDAAAIARHTEWGNVNISLNTIESIALKATRRVRGVREAKSIIKSNETGTSIILKVSVDGETPIPGIVEEIQKSVKEQVERIIGIEVKEINVKITEVAQQSSTRLSRVE